MSLVKERLVGVEGKGLVMAGFPRLDGGHFGVTPGVPSPGIYCRLNSLNRW